MATHKPQLLPATHPTSSILTRHPPPHKERDKQIKRSMHGLMGGSDYYNQSGTGGEGTVLEKEEHIGTWAY